MSRAHNSPHLYEIYKESFWCVCICTDNCTNKWLYLYLCSLTNKRLVCDLCRTFYSFTSTHVFACIWTKTRACWVPLNLLAYIWCIYWAYDICHSWHSGRMYMPVACAYSNTWSEKLYVTVNTFLGYWAGAVYVWLSCFIVASMITWASCFVSRSFQ